MHNSQTKTSESTEILVIALYFLHLELGLPKCTFKWSIQKTKTKKSGVRHPSQNMISQASFIFSPQEWPSDWGHVGRFHTFILYIGTTKTAFVCQNVLT